MLGWDINRKKKKSSLLQKSREKKKTKIFLIVAFILVFALFFILGIFGREFLLSNYQPLPLFRDGKFLVLFQNNSEIRSSGGFIGSYATVDMQNFELKNIDFNTNIQALDRQFIDNNYVVAPEVLRKFLQNKSWSLKDSNYDASFPEAAKDISYFYSKETGDNIDAVVALNAKLIIDLLKITGPIRLDKYNLTVDSNNFYDVTQYQIEKGYFENPENWVINEPKSFLKDLYPEIFKESFNKKKETFKLLKSALDKKDILLYYKDPLKENEVLEKNWGGKILTGEDLKDIFKTKEDVDYLYINSNSYSGDKSSIKVFDRIDYKVSYDEDQIKAVLTFEKKHTGTYDWPDGPNDTWTRFFVPLGSKLITAKINGRDIPTQDITTSEESGQTFFGYKVFTNPGETSTLEFSYYLPFKIVNYHLYLQKQSGALDIPVNVYWQGKKIFEGVLDMDLKI